MKKVLVLEDESSIRSFIVINLRRAGYEVIEAETGEEALEKLKEHADVRVALLDIMLPGIDGFEVCRRIRATNATIGIIMLTARSAEMDRVAGLENGADDYVVKPFGIMEFISRVRAVLRRAAAAVPAPAASTLRFGDIVLDDVSRTVRVGGVPVELTYTEFELLSYLIGNAGIALSREKILNNVWNYDYFGDARTIDTHVKKLRSKMGDKGDLIKTIWGMGYKFEADES